MTTTNARWMTVNKSMNRKRWPMSSRARPLRMTVNDEVPVVRAAGSYHSDIFALFWAARRRRKIIIVSGPSDIDKRRAAKARRTPRGRPVGGGQRTAGRRINQRRRSLADSGRLRELVVAWSVVDAAADRFNLRRQNTDGRTEGHEDGLCERGRLTPKSNGGQPPLPPHPFPFSAIEQLLFAAKR